MLPTFLTLILLALQPVCLLYTRAVMESAAAETARLMTTTTAEDDDLKEFTRRRLPQCPTFRSSCRRAVVVGYRAWPGRCGWRLVRVRFRRGQAVACDRCVCAGYGWYHQGGYVELKVDVSYQSRPEWLEECSIRGLLHGIRRCLLRVARTAARRRPGALRKRGGFIGRAGIDLFIEDGAYTTLFLCGGHLGGAHAAVFVDRGDIEHVACGDTQVAADSGALAGANVVSSYRTAATVVDASILSLGLAGFATIGTGLVRHPHPGCRASCPAMSVPTPG